MARHKTLIPASLPPQRRYATRAHLAVLYYERYGFELSPRSLERWPLAWKNVNGKAVAAVDEFLAEAQRRFDKAPSIMGGRKLNAAA